MSYIDLSTIPTPELREIRNILKYGVKSYASGEVARLRRENDELRKVLNKGKAVKKLSRVDIVRAGLAEMKRELNG